MKTYGTVEIFESQEYGTVLTCASPELADQLEDYLTECCFVFFNIKIVLAVVSFFFGEASNPINVRLLFDRFMHSRAIEVHSAS